MEMSDKKQVYYLQSTIIEKFLNSIFFLMRTGNQTIVRKSGLTFFLNTVLRSCSKEKSVSFVKAQRLNWVDHSESDRCKTAKGHCVWKN